jgi:thioredoxin reductase
MPTDAFDAVVVGGSFAGLAAAMQLARARRRVLVVDAGRPRNRFAHASHGFLGQDGRAPVAIVEAARAEVLAYPTAAFRADEVTHARDDDGEFALALASGTTVRASRLVLATGVVDELPPIHGLQERWGATVLHCPYCHGYEVRDGRLGLLATSAHSLHLALLLPDWSSDVTLFTNGAVALDEAQREVLSARGVRVDERPVEALVGDAPALAGIRLQRGVVIPLDALFTGFRTHMASPLAEQLGCAFDDGPVGQIIRTDERKATSVPGVFAAGDVARSFANATMAAADGVMAGAAAHQSLALALASTTDPIRDLHDEDVDRRRPP